MIKQVLAAVKGRMKRGYTYPLEGQCRDDLELLIAEIERDLEAALDREEQDKLMAMATVFEVGPLITSGIPVTVERRIQRDDSIRWAVKSGSYVLNRDTGELEYEPMPSSRDEDFVHRCRFVELDEALGAGRELIRVEKQRVQQAIRES